MASYKIYLKNDQPTSTGKYPLMMRIIKDRKKREMLLTHCEFPDCWDKGTNRPKKKHPYFQELTSIIINKESEVHKVILSLDAENRPYTVEDILNRLSLSVKTNNTTVFSFLEALVQKLHQQGRISTGNTFKEVLRQLRLFRSGKDLSFYDLSPQMIIRFEDFIAQRGVKVSTVHFYLRTLKTALNEARKEGLVQDNYAPFKNVSFSKFYKYKPEKRALSKNEIDAIKGFDVKSNPKHELAKDLFLFSYFCRGINFTDMAFLKWGDVKNNEIKYERKKTKKTYSFALIETAIQILNKYRIYYNGTESMVFPILSESHITPMQKDYRIEKMLKQVNKSFREISKELGFIKPFTFYSARHSFATISYHGGVPVEFITEAMGHDTEKTTREYLKEFEGETLNRAFNNVL